MNIPIIALFIIIGSGLLLGRIKILGVSFGSSAVMFTALAFGAVGCTIPNGISTLGLVLFIYCVGISAGPTFFRAFIRKGAEFAKLSIVIAICAAATTVILAYLTRIPKELALGIFAGSMTSTPALATAMDTLQHSDTISVGYGIAYPFGVIGVVLFVQLIPRLLKTDIESEVMKCQSKPSEKKEIIHLLVEILNPNIIGKKINEVTFLANSRCQISRILKGERLLPITSDNVLEQGQHILVVGKEHRLPNIVEFLGRASNKRFFMDTESQRIKVVVTSQKVAGKSLGKLNLLAKFGVTVSRITRNDVKFVPQSSTIIRTADVLSVVGESASLKAFAEYAGHRSRLINETDIISLSIGIIVGVIIGMVQVALPGSKSFKLGLAGGPLLVALVLGHFGHIGMVRGHIPRASRMLMTDIGLVFFLAGAGVKAGGQLLTIIQNYGVVLLIMGAVNTTIPIIISYFFARYILKLNLIQIIGGTCGGMTSTPGLGVISEKTDSDILLISYATAYPVALILVTLVAQAIITILS
ncbi:MAG: YidE/YbjL duplication [candidate division Zixibacteria bacterium]|nr:YidE/YbjL duplication [candidate division Zixibacteria bacterium]